jgi:hypothetical protein
MIVPELVLKVSRCFIWRLLILANICGYTVGCATTHPPLDMGDTPYRVEVYEGQAYDDIRAEKIGSRLRYGKWGYSKSNGFYQWEDGVCVIRLRKVFPATQACTLRHEMRHCLEGGWHGSEPNGDCDKDGLSI